MTALTYNGRLFQIDGKGAWLSPYSAFARLDPGTYACRMPGPGFGMREYVRDSFGWNWGAWLEAPLPAHSPVEVERRRFGAAEGL